MSETVCVKLFPTESHFDSKLVWPTTKKSSSEERIGTFYIAKNVPDDHCSHSWHQLSIKCYLYLLLCPSVKHYTCRKFVCKGALLLLMSYTFGPVIIDIIVVCFACLQQHTKQLAASTIRRALWRQRQLFERHIWHEGASDTWSRSFCRLRQKCCHFTAALHQYPSYGSKYCDLFGM